MYCVLLYNKSRDVSDHAQSNMSDIEEFFASTPEPSDIQLVAGKVKDFVDFHKKSERRIVLITVSKIVKYIASQVV